MYVNQGEHEKLFSSALVTHGMHWITKEPDKKEFHCTAKFRHRQPDQKVKVQLFDNGYVEVIFYKKQRAITPGQWVVLYNNDICLGGGIIDEVVK